MAEAAVESVEVVDVGHHQGQRLVLFGRISDRFLERYVEIFPIGKLRERIGESLSADDLRTYPKSLISFFDAISRSSTC